MKNTIKDFDLNLKSTKNEDASPSVGSRFILSYMAPKNVKMIC